MVETKAGTRVVLEIDEGQEVEAIVRDSREEEDAIVVRYIIEEWGGYKTGEYRYPKGVGDVSGIERNTNMPRDYAGKMLEDFKWHYYQQETEKQQKTVQTYLTRFDNFLRENLGLYIHSKTRGSGKTMLACCIGNEIIKRRGLNVKFVSITDYIQAYKNKAAEKFFDATVLILDDIGAEDGTKDFIREMVYQLINHRYEKNLMTIFTSNVPIEQCSKDDRVVSRVERMGAEIKIPETPVRSKQAQIKKMRMLESIMEGR